MVGLVELIKSVSLASAPLLGSLLGSPLAGIGVSLLGNAFNVDPKNIDALVATINNDPEGHIKIRSIETKHLEVLAQIAAQNYQNEVDDRKNARARELELAKNGFRDWVPTILAVGFLINYAAIQFYCVTHPVSISDVISARFQDVLIMIISYYFGSRHKTSRDLQRNSG